MTGLADLFRNPVFLRRVGVTLAALAVYRAGCWIPMPGLNVHALLARAGDPGHLDAAMQMLSLMGLGLIPLLSALIFLEVAMIVWPRLRSWASTPENRARLTGWTNAAALGFSVLQSYGIAQGLEDVSGGLVPEPGAMFRASIVATQVAATAALIWLASVINRYGIGNGVWMLIAVPYAISFVASLAVQADLWGPFSPVSMVATVGFLALTVAGMATLLKAAPPLAGTGDLIWVPVLGFSLGHWLFALMWIGQWLLLPAGSVEDFDQAANARSFSLLALVGLIVVAILRRRSLAKAQGLPFSFASAMPLAIVLAALAAVGALLEGFPAQPLVPSPVAVMLLAAVGLAIVNDLGVAKPDERT